jgi:hypothetical protein
MLGSDLDINQILIKLANDHEHLKKKTKSVYFNAGSFRKSDSLDHFSITEAIL